MELNTANPTPPHVANVGDLIRYKGKVYIRAKQQELPIKVHKGCSYVNYAGQKIAISKIAIYVYDAVFSYVFEYGHTKQPNAQLEAIATQRLTGK